MIRVGNGNLFRNETVDRIKKILESWKVYFVATFAYILLDWSQFPVNTVSLKLFVMFVDTRLSPSMVDDWDVVSLKSIHISVPSLKS